MTLLWEADRNVSMGNAILFATFESGLVCCALTNFWPMARFFSSRHTVPNLSLKWVMLKRRVQLDPHVFQNPFVCALFEPESIDGSNAPRMDPPKGRDTRQPARPAAHAQKPPVSLRLGLLLLIPLVATGLHALAEPLGLDRMPVSTIVYYCTMP